MARQCRQRGAPACIHRNIINASAANNLDERTGGSRVPSKCGRIAEPIAALLSDA